MKMKSIIKLFEEPSRNRQYSIDGWMVGWTDGWLDGWIDGWMDRRRSISNFLN
jgi:hypothetical protein